MKPSGMSLGAKRALLWAGASNRPVGFGQSFPRFCVLALAWMMVFFFLVPCDQFLSVLLTPSALYRRLRSTFALSHLTSKAKKYTSAPPRII